MSGMTVGTCPSPTKRVQDALSLHNKLAETTTASNTNVNQWTLTSMLPNTIIQNTGIALISNGHLRTLFFYLAMHEKVYIL